MGEPLTPLDLREALDGAVRCLAVSSRSIQERLRASAEPLRGLSSKDFSFSEDASLFERVESGLRTFDERPAENAAQALDAQALTDAVCERLAGEILDLRDAQMGRAIREARLKERRSVARITRLQ